MVIKSEIGEDYVITRVNYGVRCILTRVVPFLGFLAGWLELVERARLVLVPFMFLGIFVFRTRAQVAFVGFWVEREGCPLYRSVHCSALIWNVLIP